MFTLAKSITGGVNWGEVAGLAAHLGGFYVLVVTIFIFFTAFSVVNIVTGVFVDAAIEMTKTDRLAMLERSEHEKTAVAEQLIYLLTEMDSDSNGVLDYHEFEKSLQRKDVRDYLAAMDIDVGNACKLFSRMDRDGNGCVDVVEFVQGMWQVKGQAKAADVKMVLEQVRKLTTKVNLLHDLICEAPIWPVDFDERANGDQPAQCALPSMCPILE